jgi:hypothetical protein
MRFCFRLKSCFCGISALGEPDIALNLTSVPNPPQIQDAPALLIAPLKYQIKQSEL